MQPDNPLKRFWHFLKEDTWQSWIVSIILIIVLIKFVVFPLLSLATGTSLPLVVVESCSMYHQNNFDSWWQKNSDWYESYNITKTDFENYPFKNGINKGDIIIVTGYSKPALGKVMIFNSQTKYPIIHRLVSISTLQTKGDNNPSQISGVETDIKENQIVGYSIFRIPYLGWVKLIFFEPFKTPDKRGFCK